MGNFSFHRLTAEDLPLLASWLATPHVRQWWGNEYSLADVEEDYLPSIRGEDPTSHYLAYLDREPIGMIQSYYWHDYPAEVADVDAAVGDIGIDYLIGKPNKIGSGLGPQMITAFIDDIVTQQPHRDIRIYVSVANERSWRCLQKIGFYIVGEPKLVDGEDDLQYVLIRST